MIIISRSKYNVVIWTTGPSAHVPSSFIFSKKLFQSILSKSLKFFFISSTVFFLDDCANLHTFNLRMDGFICHTFSSGLALSCWQHTVKKQLPSPNVVLSMEKGRSNFWMVRITASIMNLKKLKSIKRCYINIYAPRDQPNQFTCTHLKSSQHGGRNQYTYLINVLHSP